jgi:lipopolysaccharide/colanic/teichoic acid biosynthesis glycosyltransferase
MRVPTPTSRSHKRVYLSLWDLIWAVASPPIALYLRNVDLLHQADWTMIGYYWGLSSGFALLAFLALRIQDGMTRYFSVHEALDILEAVLFATLMTCGVLFTLTRLDGIPRSMPLLQGLVLATGVIASRLVIRIVRSSASDLQDYRCSGERIILIGVNRVAGLFIQMLSAYAPMKQHIIAVLDDDRSIVGKAISGVQVMGTPQELDSVVTEFAVHGVTADRVVIAGEADFLSSPVLHEVERICQRRQMTLSYLPRMIGLTQGTELTAAPKRRELEKPGFAIPAYFRVKRWIDVFGSLALLVMFSPLFLVAGLLVLVDVGSPILFWQERLGWKGQSFLLYKFRTLKAPFDSEGNPKVTGRHPSRIGHFLRATRLDEMPQLLNVLLGDMSLFGPRPLLPEDQPANTSIRLLVRPGISGWAQVNGGKLVTTEEKELLDEHYVRNASPLMDVHIAILTFQLIFRSRFSAPEAKADLQQVQNKNFNMADDLGPKSARHG